MIDNEKFLNPINNLSENVKRLNNQALADLGYPKDVRENLDQDEISYILSQNLTFDKMNREIDSITDDVKPEKQVSENKNNFEMSEYIAINPILKAGYQLNLEEIKNLIKNPKDLKNADRDEMFMNLVTRMAFQDYKKAEDVIKYLKSIGAYVYKKDDKDNQSAIDIATRRSNITPEYLNLLEVLKE